MPGSSWPQKPPIGTVLERNTLTQGLVGFWALNEGTGLVASDSAGTAFGAVKGSLAWAPSAAGLCLSGFAGGSTAATYVDCGNSPALNPTAAFSIVACVYPTSLAATGLALARDDNALGRSFAFGLNATSGTPHLEINGAGAADGTTLAASPNAWSVVGCSASPGGSSLFVGGLPAGTGTWAAPNATTGPTTIGKRTYSGVNNGFAGKIAWVGLWNIPLPSQIHRAIGASPNAIWPLIYKPSRTRSFSLAAAAIPVNYTVTGPATLTAGQAGTYTVQPAAATTDTVTVSDGGQGGTITPSSLSWSNSSAAQTFTYSNAAAGTYTLTLTSAKGGAVSGSPITVTVSAAAPAIIVRRPSRWAQKPPVGTTLDPSSSLTRGLLSFIPLNEGTGLASDLAAGIASTAQLGTWAATPAGRGLALAGGASSYVAFPAAALTYQGPLTVAYGAALANAVPSGTYLSAVTLGGWEFGWDAGHLSVNCDAYPSQGWLSADCPVACPFDGHPHVYAVSCPAGSSPSLNYYLDGTPLGTHSQTNAQKITSGITGLSNNNSTYAMPGTYLWAAAWTRLLTDAEHAALAANPWQLFRPRYRVVVAAAPAPAPTGVVTPTSTVNQIGYQFDEPVIATGLAFAVTVLATGAAIGGTIAYNSGTYLATFTPTVPFVRGTKYHVTVSGATATDDTPMVPDTFIFDPGTGRRIRYSPGRGRRVGRLIA